MFAECANRGFPRLPRGGGAPTPRPEGLRPRTPCGGHLRFPAGPWGFAPCPLRWSPLVVCRALGLRPLPPAVVAFGCLPGGFGASPLAPCGGHPWFGAFN